MTTTPSIYPLIQFEKIDSLTHLQLKSLAHIGSNYEKSIEKVIKSNIFTREVFGYLSMI